MAKKKILFIGESWQVHVTEAKGYDTFSYDYYEVATGFIKSAVESNDYEFVHIPAHMVDAQFPKTLDELLEYAVVMVSDVGANTFNLPMNTFIRLNPMPNKLKMLREYVERGGAFVMIGGYLAYTGFQARGAYKRTPIEEILPVTMLEGDDRMEESDGATARIELVSHPVVAGLPNKWPALLGYNLVIPKENSTVIATINNNPLIVVGSYGKGRTCAYTTDCAPHWSPEDFCTWEGYSRLWGNLINWLTQA